MKNESAVQQFDHRKIGVRLGFFRMDAKVGLGLPLWLPNGTVVRQELEKLAEELEFDAGFDRVATPHLAAARLYEQSGHLPYYENDMFPRMGFDKPCEPDQEQANTSFALRPMNCPHHHRVFAAQKRSYRELPLRLAEFGQVYRWEPSGSLSGLSRARGMCMNDGHIYCAPEQVEHEINQVLAMYRKVYGLLGIRDYQFRLSQPDKTGKSGKYLGQDHQWEWAAKLLKRVLDAQAESYFEGAGHAAFYGPKIDVQIRTTKGSEETLSTVQLDFVQPSRMGLSYVDRDGSQRVPLCIHRAPLSTHERLVAHLLELYSGWFPTWLSPIQVYIVPVSDQFREYALDVVSQLRKERIRAILSRESDTVANQIRYAIENRYPNVLVLGNKEAQAGTVSWRTESGQTTLGLEPFKSKLLQRIKNREWDIP